MAADDKPSTRQLRYLRRLAEQTGTSFVSPATKREASRQISQLKKRPRSAGFERRQDAKAVSDAFTDRQPASSVRPDEIDGYGAHATWR